MSEATDYCLYDVPLVVGVFHRLKSLKSLTENNPGEHPKAIEASQLFRSATLKRPHLPHHWPIEMRSKVGEAQPNRIRNERT